MHEQQETLNRIQTQTTDFLNQQKKESSSRMDPMELMKAIVKFKRTGTYEKEKPGESLTPIEKGKSGDEKQPVEVRDYVLSEG